MHDHPAVDAHAPAFLDAKCTDLTQYLAGDAIRDYPNLAAIPSRSWKGALVNGKIYGVPIPPASVLLVVLGRQGDPGPACRRGAIRN